MLHVEPFLKENVVMWSILLPLMTVDTHFSGLTVRSRSEYLSSIVNKRDKWSSGEEEKSERSSAKALADWLDELKNLGLEVSSLIFLSGNWGGLGCSEDTVFVLFLWIPTWHYGEWLFQCLCLHILCLLCHLWDVFSLLREKAFRSNPWKFSKSVCEQSSRNTPTFSQAACLSYFKSSCDISNQSYCGLPDWV